MLEDFGSSASSFSSQMILFFCLENSGFFILNVKCGYHLRMYLKDFKDASFSTEETVNSWMGSM